jgi:threonine synthase
MNYISTRGAAPRLGFEEAMLAGLARDGGLYLPESWPQLSHAEIERFAGLPYEEVAFRVMRPFVGDAFDEAEFRADHRPRLRRSSARRRATPAARRSRLSAGATAPTSSSCFQRAAFRPSSSAR